LYQLDLGEGYLLHGTPHEESIGYATTHGCVRLRGHDIEWLFANVPVGTPVYLY
jgi:lipoprotein-anchoring transpeptidase ErfK/SrfK